MKHWYEWIVVERREKKLSQRNSSMSNGQHNRHNPSVMLFTHESKLLYFKLCKSHLSTMGANQNNIMFPFYQIIFTIH